MKDRFSEIDLLIERVKFHILDPLFTNEFNKRQNKEVSVFLDDNEILRTFSYLIAYSQNSNSELVERLILSGNLDTAFNNFTIDDVAKMNPCFY